MSIWRFVGHFAPEVPERHRLSLGEGGTPCLPSRTIGPAAGLARLFFKLESVNPSGSYKDRFAALAVSHMRARGQDTCLATSSGNTGAALAAYCAAARIRCRIAVVETAPLAKLQQMLAYGAEIERVAGFGTDAGVTRTVMERLAERAARENGALHISAYHWSPLGMEGVESLAFELAEQIPAGTGHVFCPAGGGGLTLAVARGGKKIGWDWSTHCVQPEGNNTIAGPLREGGEKAREVTCTSTISGLQVATVIDGDETLAASRESGGTGHLVSDAQVYEAQRRLAREEGIFSEPAGAVALAGLLQAAERGEINPAQPVVCLVTGSGFKDTPSLERMTASADCPTVSLDDLFTRR